ncbi:hypothetical protein RJT34_04971 [Clitoria ternatea]|uniref:Uncharacterized protein n=1 Tax=Clitoria ternatea TaxID=43366 RepID=A0AAN9PSS8_CLITE
MVVMVWEIPRVFFSRVSASSSGLSRDLPNGSPTRVVAPPVKPGKNDGAEEVAQVQGLGGGVETAIELERGRGRRGFEIVASCGFDKASLFEDLDDVGTRWLLLLLESASGSGELEREGVRKRFEEFG